jgi:hypothetical protein
MINEYGREKVEEAATALITAGGRAYPSAVRKYLAEEKQKTQQKERELQVMKNQEVVMDQESRKKGEGFLASVRKKRHRGG